MIMIKMVQPLPPTGPVQEQATSGAPGPEGGN
jgi:hypothetical protein